MLCFLLLSLLVPEVPGLLSEDGHGDVVCTTHGSLRGNIRGLDGVVLVLHGLLSVFKESVVASLLSIASLKSLRCFWELLTVHHSLGGLDEDVVTTSHVVRG